MKAQRMCVGCERWLPVDLLFQHGLGLHCRPCIEDDDLRCGKCVVCKELAPATARCGSCDKDFPVPADEEIPLVSKRPYCPLCFASLQDGLTALRNGATVTSDEFTN